MFSLFSIIKDSIDKKIRTLEDINNYSTILKNDINSIVLKYTSLRALLVLVREIYSLLQGVDEKSIKKKIKDNKQIYSLLKPRINKLIKEYSLRRKYLIGKSGEIVTKHISSLILLFRNNSNTGKVIMEISNFYKELNNEYMKVERHIKILMDFIRNLKEE